MFVPLAALATPIVFVTDWSFRILFPIPEREERTLTEQETKTETKPAARQDGAQEGFAVTLSIGLIANMFTAVLFTRLIFDFMLGRRRVERLSI
jgi:hypothetical protein